MSYVSQMQTMGVIRPQNVQEHYGISAESLSEIQKTHSPIKSKPAEQLSLPESQVISQFQEALEFQAVQFKRYKNQAEQKFISLSKDLMEMSIQLKQALAFMETVKNKEELGKARESLLAYQQGTDKRTPVDRPIDRNGVAPKDVQIETIFNCAGKKF